MPRPPSFTVRLRTSLGEGETWARLWDLDAHSRVIWLTEVTREPPGGSALTGIGDRFVARTRLGPWRLDDRMVVRAWDAPRHAVIDKVGTPLGGRITVDVVPSGSGCLVHWHQTYRAVGVPHAFAWLSWPVVRTGYALTLHRLLTADVDPAPERAKNLGVDEGGAG